MLHNTVSRVRGRRSRCALFSLAVQAISAGLFLLLQMMVGPSGVATASPMPSAAAVVAFAAAAVGAPPTVAKQLPDLRVKSGAANAVIGLCPYFTDPAATNTVVRFNTVKGTFDVQLYDSKAPRTVANFLNNVNRQEYVGSMVQRSAKNADGTPFVIQGGGYTWDTTQLYPVAVTADPAIASEFTGTANVRGTIAMALGSNADGTTDVNSATDQWYVNLGDNSGLLDKQDFTVFGQVVGNGMTTVDAIAALEAFNFGGDFAEIPLINYTDADYNNWNNTGTPAPVTANIVVVSNIAVVSGGTTLTFTATSDNPTVVTPTVTATTLVLTYGSATSGMANVTVRATNANNQYVEQSFAVTIVQPPVVNADSATTAINTAKAIDVLANDTAQTYAIDPATVAIAQAPTNGKTAVDPGTGKVTYTPNTGYAGADSFTYTVNDIYGFTSAAATVSIQITAPGLTPYISKTLPDLSIDLGSANTVINLSGYFGPGTNVHFDTNLGQFDTELYDGQAPITVANFLAYVTAKAYNSTLIHRVVANFVIQGGGYLSPSETAITANVAIKNEFGTSNTRGTMAMALVSGNPNSATDQWFINLADNSSSLDAQQFTVFGHVLNAGMTVVDAIAAVPTYAFSDPFGQLPLQNYTTFPNPGPTAANFVTVNSVAVSYALTYTAASNNTVLVTATVSGNNLTLAYAPTGFGTAQVTVRATGTNGLFIEQSFQVTVSGAPAATDDAATVTGPAAVQIDVLANDTPRGSPIDPTTVTIVTAPLWGTATADPTTGIITYTPPTGYLGMDPFTYTVKDAKGRASNAATVSVTLPWQTPTPFVTKAFDDLKIEMGILNTAVSVVGHFGPGTEVRYDTNLGQYDIELFDAKAPNTVDNFLAYVNAKDYDSTIIERVVAGFVIQSGGYTFPDLNYVPSNAAIKNEFGYSNKAGTIAMALTTKTDGTTDVNSATNEWFINLADNSSSLDSQKFTVFAHVLGDGMKTVGAIAAVPIFDLSSLFGSPFAELPLLNYTSDNQKNKVIPVAADYVEVKTVAVTYGLTYSATSDTPDLVTPTVSGKTITLAYGFGNFGTAQVTVRATDNHGAYAQTTFKVVVTGPPVANDDAPWTYKNTPVNVDVLANDTPQGSPIDPTTVAIVTPSKGSTSVDPVSGVVAYTPPKDFTGIDTFTYTVKDVQGRTSRAAAVMVGIIGLTVQIGDAPLPGSMQYTDPDGTAVTIALKGGVAKVYLTGTPTKTQTGSVVVVKGTGVQAYRIELSNTTTASALTFTTSGGTASGAAVGTITSSNPLGKIQGSTIDLNGQGILMTGGGTAASVTLRDLLNGARLVMPGAGATAGITLSLHNIPNSKSDIALGSPLTSLTCAQWVGGNLWAPTASKIAVVGDKGVGLPGNLGANLLLDGASAGHGDLGSATIAGQITGGTWAIHGNVGTVTAGSTAAAWTLAAQGTLTSLSAATDLAGTVTAASLGTVKVGRQLAAILTATDPNAAHVSIGSLTAALAKGAKVSVPGGISALSVSSWQGGQINAAWLTSLTTSRNGSQNLSGDISGTTWVLSGAGNPAQTLGKATIVGKVSQTNWSMKGNIGTVKGGVFDQFGWSVQGNLSLFSFVQVTNAALSVAGAIGTLQGVLWDTGTVQAYSLGTLSIAGNPVLGVHGNFTPSLFLTGKGVASGKQTLGSAYISYAIANGGWDITGDVGSVKAFIYQDCALNFHGSVGTLALKYVNSSKQGHPAVTVDGTLGNAGTLFWDGGTLKAGSITSASLGGVSNLALTATNTIGTLGAYAWSGGSITAKTLTELDIIGSMTYGVAPDFQADITLTGGAAKTLGTVNIGRRVTGGTWTITGGIDKVSVYSLFQNCKVYATGNVGTFAVGAMNGSTVYAGVASGVTGLPTAKAQFSSASTIASLIVRGVPVAFSAHSFANSFIAASNVASAAVVNVNTDNSANTPATFGVAGRTVGTVLWQQNSATHRWPTVTWPVNTGNFVVKVVP